MPAAWRAASSPSTRNAPCQPHAWRERGHEGCHPGGRHWLTPVPVDAHTNKHLLPIYDRPMIAWAIEAVVSSGIDEIMLVTGGRMPVSSCGCSATGASTASISSPTRTRRRREALPRHWASPAHFAEGGPVLVMLADKHRRALHQAVCRCLPGRSRRRPHPSLESGPAGAPAPPRGPRLRGGMAGWRNRGRSPRNRPPSTASRHSTATRQACRHHRRPRALRPRRARDHRREQPLRRKGRWPMTSQEASGVTPGVDSRRTTR